jgi:hypothetical protein
MIMDLLGQVYHAKDTEERRKAIQQGKTQPGLIDVYRELKTIKKTPKQVPDYKKAFEEQKSIFDKQKENLEYIDKLQDLKIQKQQLDIKTKWKKQELNPGPLKKIKSLFG